MDDQATLLPHPPEIPCLPDRVDFTCYLPQPQFADDWPEAERAHWAYQPLRRPPLPRLRQCDWARNPIDAFIIDRLRQEGLRPAAAADSVTLVRRLAFSITGLPPSIQDVERLNSAASQKFDQYVDALLASPRFGEHWATYWLDLVRYADTNGYENDGQKPLAWKYRDFVIQSLNDDRPYDEFVRMQIAGDIQDEPRDVDFIAAGFLRLGAWDSEPDDELVARYHQLDDIVSTTGLVFLGMTVGCARCHDHREEPITATDYARLIACFHGLGRPAKGRLETAFDSATDQQLAAAAVTRRQQRNLQRRAFFTDDANQAAALRRKASRIEDHIGFEQAYRFVETEMSKEPTRRLSRGNPHQPAESVDAGVPSILAHTPFNDDLLPRRQLAQWLITTQQALTARLIVNRIWAWHFGHGLVETPSNFGLSGSLPTHPELLEWLAVWFAHDADWSLKALHRLILTSQTYRTRVDLQNDRRQQLYGSFPRRRLRAEVLRDAMLMIANLQIESMYGAPLPRPLSEGNTTSLAGEDRIGSNSIRRRRAIYSIVTRTEGNELLTAFDASPRAASCSMRRTTHSPQQALMLWNGPSVQACAGSLADQIAHDNSLSSAEKVGVAFSRMIGRSPDAFERAELQRFLDRQKRAGGSENVALGQLCLVLFNSDEFVFLD